MLSSRKPASAANALTAIKVAPENGALRKNRTSISGSARLDSTRISTTSATRAAQKQAMMRGEVHPAAGPFDDAVDEGGEDHDDQRLPDRVDLAGPRRP